MAKTKGLGKGLGSIFGDDLETVLEDIQSGPQRQEGKVEIPISEIRANPYQPRKKFDDAKLNELAESIREHGVFTPILVRKSFQGYELIAGERRLRASKAAKKETIPAILVEFSDQEMMEIALLENVQREDLNAIEEANGYNSLIERLGYTQEQCAKRVGKSREYVANLLRLLKLPRSIQQLVTENKISMGHARPLITLEDEGLAYDIACRIIDEGLSVREVERLVKAAKEKQPEKKEKKTDDYSYVVEIMEDRLQTKVKVDNKQIVIKYNGTEDLNRILELIHCIEE